MTIDTWRHITELPQFSRPQLQPNAYGLKERDFDMVLLTVGRALSLFIGSFSLLSLAAELRWPSYTPNLCWIDLRWIPQTLAWVLHSIVAVVLIAHGLTGQCSRWRRRMTFAAVVLLLAGALWNSAQFYSLSTDGKIQSRFPVPLSLLVFLALLVVLKSLTVQMPRLPRRRVMWLLPAAVVLCGVAFPVSLMYCFGMTDYRRPADVIVVFGARTYANGRPSLALEDRVRTACQLYHAGFASQMVVSGGPGDGTIHETDAMRQLAVELGVPFDAIAVDKDGLNTWETVRNTRGMIDGTDIRRILAVSHFYHLPRVKLAFQRHGFDVWTVPARESRTLVALPYYMAREVMAFWAYYLRAIVS